VIRSIRRLATIGISALVASAFVAGPAHADTVETFLGNATGTALDLNVLGNKTTFGYSSADAASSLAAKAQGAGQLLNDATTTQAQVSAAGATQSAPQKCATPALPAQVSSVLDVGVACSDSQASDANGLPTASSEGSVAAISLSANTVLSKVPVPIGDILDQALQPLTSTPLDPVKTTVVDLVNSVLKTQTLSVSVGKSTSTVATAAGTVTSTAVANGADVKILPLPTGTSLSGQPVAEIIVGNAKATAVYDRSTGKSTATPDPALVTVKLAPLAGIGGQTISVAPGQTQTILTGTPLESTIAVAAGSTVKNADGTVGAIADGVSLDLLKGISGGVSLKLAHAVAGVGGSPAVHTQAAVETPLAAPQLPRTGGPGWLPAAGAAVIIAAYLTRRVAVRQR
jgi:hypothetical protein